MVDVLVVDDQRPFRTAARGMLEATEDFRVIGEATSGEQAIELAASLQPRLVLMDVLLPGIDGIDATRRIVDASPGTAVVLVSTRRRNELPAALDRCGAAGFFQKEDLDPDALEALLDVSGQAP
jgi:DNA-binding NarL/FixJ family response regulator